MSCSLASLNPQVIEEAQCRYVQMGVKLPSQSEFKAELVATSVNLYLKAATEKCNIISASKIMKVCTDGRCQIARVGRLFWYAQAPNQRPGTG
jgi:hypothetical protein